MAIHGKCWGWHKWLTIFYHVYKNNLVRWPSCCFWQSYWRNGECIFNLVTSFFVFFIVVFVRVLDIQTYFCIFFLQNSNWKNCTLFFLECCACCRKSEDERSWSTNQRRSNRWLWSFRSWKAICNQKRIDFYSICITFLSFSHFY